MYISYEEGHNKTAPAEGFSAGTVESFAVEGMGDLQIISMHEQRS